MLQIKFFTSFAIGCGTHIGPHADIINLLKEARCVVINVDNGYQHFAYHANKLLKIADMKIRNDRVLKIKPPKLTGGFPKIPIIVITESAFVDVVKQQATSNNIAIDKIILGKLSSKNTWIELDQAIMQVVLQKQKKCKKIIEKGNGGKCLMQ